MPNLITWLKSKNITAHLTAVSLATVAGIIKFDTDVQTLMIKFLKGHPEAASEIILLAGIIFRYSKSSTPDNRYPNSNNNNTQEIHDDRT